MSRALKMWQCASMMGNPMIHPSSGPIMDRQALGHDMAARNGAGKAWPNPAPSKAVRPPSTARRFTAEDEFMGPVLLSRVLDVSRVALWAACVTVL